MAISVIATRETLATPLALSSRKNMIHEPVVTLTARHHSS
jgi:hypothetical protein